MLRNHLPEQGLYMLRYHSFYAWHREGAYDHPARRSRPGNAEMGEVVQPYDLYSKSPEPPD